MELSTLAPRRGKRRVARRLGRGESSGRGKTCGKGQKGQTSRSGGKIPARFEGGQMPLYRRIPKIGFKSQIGILGRNFYTVVNLDTLEKFENGATVDCESLSAKGITCGRDAKAGIKILGSGELTKKLTVKVQAISESARKKIESLGGTIEII